MYNEDNAHERPHCRVIQRYSNDRNLLEYVICVAYVPVGLGFTKPACDVVVVEIGVGITVELTVGYEANGVGAEMV
jgi:hypothetical protein